VGSGHGTGGWVDRLIHVASSDSKQPIRITPLIESQRSEQSTGATSAIESGMERPPPEPARRISLDYWLNLLLDRSLYGVSFAIVFLMIPFTLYLLYVHLHLNGAAVLFPPDSGYYTVMTLRDLGYSVPHAVHRTNSYTTFPVTNSMFSDGNNTWLLVRSRVLYPLLSAPFVAALGLKFGMLVVPTISVVVFLFFTGRTLQRLYGPTVAVFVTFFVSLSYVLTEEIYFATTDLLALAFLSIFFDNLPLYRRNSKRNNIMLCVALLLIAVTRQDGVYPLALLCGGWLWSAVAARSLRNDWTLPMLIIAPITLVVDIVSQVISPVHVQTLVSTHAGATGVGGTIASVPGLAWSLTIADFHFMQAQDKVLFTLFCVAVIFMVFRPRSVETGLMIAGAAAVYLIIVPVGVPVGMRYEIVLVPVTAVIAGRVVQGLRERMTVPQQARRSSTSMR
jgi:hypothetical protein